MTTCLQKVAGTVVLTVLLPQSNGRTIRPSELVSLSIQIAYLSADLEKVIHVARAMRAYQCYRGGDCYQHRAALVRGGCQAFVWWSGL